MDEGPSKGQKESMPASSTWNFQVPAKAAPVTFAQHQKKLYDQKLEEAKAKLKPKKAAISPEMLDTANTYDDKVAVIRMIVSDEAGRVSNVFKTMMQKDMDTA